MSINSFGEVLISFSEAVLTPSGYHSFNSDVLNIQLSKNTSLISNWNITIFGAYFMKI